MNLFWKKFFGGITSTSKFEKEIKQLQEDTLRYMQVEQSVELKEYNELLPIVNSAGFKEKKQSFKKNKEEYKTTPEYQTETRFNELASNPDIIFFKKVKQPEVLKKYTSFKKTFDEEFDWNTLSGSTWHFGYHYANSALLKNHSYSNEQQANNSGKNIVVRNGIMTLSTKQEKVKALAWNGVKGFIEKEFNYTSDVMQSAEKLRQQYGVFQAKLRCSGKINHAFWLGGDDKLPLIKVFHYDGKSIRVGSVDKNGSNEKRLTGLNPSGLFIYTLIWTEKDLTWLINNMVVHKVTTNIPKEKMYLAFNSFISESQKAQEGCLEVDWVRVYSNE